MGIFLASHLPRGPCAGIKQPGFLIDSTASFQHFYLPFHFIINGLHDKANRVQIFGLGTGTQLIARAAHRHIYICPQRPLFHIAVTGSKIAQDRAQFFNIGAGLFCRPQIRARDNFHQCHTGAIQINIAFGGMLIMQGFSGILFQMDTLNPDIMGRAIRQLYGQHPLANNRMFELADLIALRQICIKVIFAIKHTVKINISLQSKPGFNRLTHTSLINDWQHARHRGINQRDILVWARTKSG